MLEGRLFDIQHFGVHDGPGIRTLVFFKGCPLRCAWCCNPESQSPDPRIRYIDFNCNGCYGCLAVCPKDAITPGSKTTLEIDFLSCAACISKPCLQACNHGALTLTGYSISSGKLIEIIKKDMAFYRNSGGGVTFTGGEPLAQTEFLAEILNECKKEGIHTAIETCGYGSHADLERIIPLTDLFLFDIKLIDPEKHRQYTGRSNQLILDNLAFLALTRQSIRVRFPLIPGITDTDENINDVILLMKKLGLTEIDLKPYHSLGVAKYSEFGISNRMDETMENAGYPAERLSNIQMLFTERCHPDEGRDLIP
jgi:pyruvate formate lyase activating enzyme